MTQPGPDAGTATTAGPLPGEAPDVEPARPAERVTLGLLLATLGALLVFIAAFLRWATVNVISRAVGSNRIGGGVFDASGIDGNRLGKETLILSIGCFALIAMMTLPRSRGWAWLVLAAFGVVIVVLAILEAVTIPETNHVLTGADCPSPAVQCFRERTVGPGVWITLAAGVLVVVGAVVHHLRPGGLRRTPAATDSANSVAA